MNDNKLLSTNDFRNFVFNLFSAELLIKYSGFVGLLRDLSRYFYILSSGNK